MNANTCTEKALTGRAFGAAQYKFLCSDSPVSPFIVLSVFEGRSAGRDIGEQISCLMLSPYLESVLMLLLSSE